jgi:predicted HAD superfamily Cof-like phosphohydrolase
MTNIQIDVAEFMKKAGQDVQSFPTIPQDEKRILHASLILEEFLETLEGMGLKIGVNTETGKLCVTDSDLPIDMIATYDGLLDLSYVINGAANAWGLNMQKGHDEVHRSNMSKFIDGYRREDGKWVKGPSYSPASLEKILAEEIELKFNK